MRDKVWDAPQPPLPYRFTGLGYRAVGYKPTVVDHEVYEIQRDRFCGSPRGRAALFAGGIVGRLARLAADEDLAALGPTNDVLISGVRLWDGRSLTAYWDDMLTDEEIDLICGVYEIGTGASTGFSSFISWWPKPNAFSHSGLNTGWWSPNCEKWFQQRLSLIKSGKAKLQTQAEWQRLIKFYKASREVASANERMAAEFLDTVLDG
ncbi:hypothetical protein C8R44DRAFT_608026 [Mycena epipterygia]|nr:hypothetical protein C8R44DRAFT_608026 [Mycena epipterygia]